MGGNPLLIMSSLWYTLVVQSLCERPNYVQGNFSFPSFPSFAGFEGFEGFGARKIRGFFSRVFPVLKISRIFSMVFSRAGKFGKSPPQAGKIWICHPKSVKIPLKSTTSITVRCLETQKNPPAAGNRPEGFIQWIIQASERKTNRSILRVFFSNTLLYHILY